MSEIRVIICKPLYISLSHMLFWPKATCILMKICGGVESYTAYLHTLFCEGLQ